MIWPLAGRPTSLVVGGRTETTPEAEFERLEAAVRAGGRLEAVPAADGMKLVSPDLTERRPEPPAPEVGELGNEAVLDTKYFTLFGTKQPTEVEDAISVTTEKINGRGDTAGAGGSTKDCAAAWLSSVLSVFLAAIRVSGGARPWAAASSSGTISKRCAR